MVVAEIWIITDLRVCGWKEMRAVEHDNDLSFFKWGFSVERTWYFTKAREAPVPN